MAVLPTSPTALSADWLDASLHESGVLSTSHVTDARHEVVGEGTGVFGQLARISLAYDTREDGAPSTLIAKMASASDGNRQIGSDLGLYERELAFYEQLAGECVLRVPHCYYLARGAGLRAAQRPMVEGPSPRYVDLAAGARCARSDRDH